MESRTDLGLVRGHAYSVIGLAEVTLKRSYVLISIFVLFRKCFLVLIAGWMFFFLSVTKKRPTPRSV